MRQANVPKIVIVQHPQLIATVKPLPPLKDVGDDGLGKMKRTTEESQR